MPLSNNTHYGVVPLTESINLLPNNPTTIRSMRLFQQTPIKTTAVTIKKRAGELSLVPAMPRGGAGQPVEGKSEGEYSFSVPHFPQDDVVLPDDVQNLKEFGTQNQARAVASVVNEKLADMKSNLEYTREHLQLGALQGKVMDKDGSVLVDLHKKFGIKKTTKNWAMDKDATNLNIMMDDSKQQIRKNLKGVAMKGFACICGSDFMEWLKYHPSIKELYEKFQVGASKYLDDEKTLEIQFEHKGIKFIQQVDKFGTDADLADDKGILLPIGTRKVFHEYFAPGDFNHAVNTKGKPYYASRQAKDHNRGWDLHSQTNALPLVLRPELLIHINGV